jgi:hypothetical protein
VHLDVRVDEDHDIAVRLPRADVSRGGGTEVARLVDDDYLLRGLGCTPNSVECALESHSAIRRGNHNRQRRHLLSVGGASP